MRTNSINNLMSGVAVCDLTNMAYIVFTKVLSIFVSTRCFNIYGYYKIFMEHWFQRADEIFRPSSAWLSVIISLVRVLVVKFPLNSKFDVLSKPKFAIASILGTIFVWFLPVFFFRAADRIEDANSPWCSFSENYTEPRYQYGVPEYFLSGLMMSSKLYQYIGGCGKIGLTVILPILTLLLVIEIRKAERNRNNVIASQRTSTKNNQTTKMIFSMTLASMITEGINGILLFWTTAYQDGSYDNISYRRKIFVITSFESMNGILIVLNTMSHFFFALMLSSQYKNTAKNLFICKVLGIPKFTSSRAVSNINMASSTSASTNHGLVKVD
ncbi:Protein CBG16979 [Caenorhabditis briggsae]|uniref:Protein CBG16979 n=1 Tax=Caenorhabditis briggsae TaxID=6238 RepID=A8XQ67_CAEBR|nr:Protein CBG16979 [Caenorhabditis briggsae]CAP34793.1 Protein CBG16979 [Caenorhabditis briggsae]